jgi:hypothetical protein
MFYFWMKQKSYKKDHASNISAKFGCKLSCGLWDKKWCMKTDD